MMNEKPIRTALISVYSKDLLKPLLQELANWNVQFISTGGTQQFIAQLGFQVDSVESLTEYPSILDGRVKTLHPKIFGGILARSQNPSDQEELARFQIQPIDMVIVDLYPFQKTVTETDDEARIIEDIDIGGVSLIRATAKNFNDTLIVSQPSQYSEVIELLQKKNGCTDLNTRKRFAMRAFEQTSQYDQAIHHYFAKVCGERKTLRYGENPHQKGSFTGKWEDIFSQKNGKEISYNNLLDIEAALSLIAEFQEPTFAIIKHNNACGLASNPSLAQAWKMALAGDPISAFGGVLICNRRLDIETAKAVDQLFFEALLAPDYQPEALELLSKKKNRIILETRPFAFPPITRRTLLNGSLEQERDNKTEGPSDLTGVTLIEPTPDQVSDLLFANKIVKHSRSNAIVLARNGQMLASGAGETSRIDALKHAIEKANTFGNTLSGAVMASDAFFPFADSVETAHKAGITAVIQPGGSVKDQESIDFCNSAQMTMVFTGIRHFRH